MTLIQKMFKGLAAKWKRDTRMLSSVTTKSQHPAYQQIIAMGMAAVPLILADLRCNPGTDWFYALSKITSENPIAEADAGYTKKMTDVWLQWGRKRGMLTLPQRIEK